MNPAKPKENCISKLMMSRPCFTQTVWCLNFLFLETGKIINHLVYRRRNSKVGCCMLFFPLAVLALFSISNPKIKRELIYIYIYINKINITCNYLRNYLNGYHTYKLPQSLIESFKFYIVKLSPIFCYKHKKATKPTNDVFSYKLVSHDTLHHQQ
jgi:hypothetical protein